MLKKLVPRLAALAAAAPEAAARAALSGTPDSFAASQERASLKKLYKSLGREVPKPRRMSPEAARMHNELMNASGGRSARPSQGLWPRAGVRRGPSPTSRRPDAPGTRPAVLGVEAAGPAAAEGVRLWTSGEGGTTAEEDQVDRILDAGTCALLHSEDGREALREGSFNVEATSQVVLEAAEAALAHSEEGHHEEDARQAHEAAEELRRGGHGGPVAQLVKEKVTGFGQTG